MKTVVQLLLVIALFTFASTASAVVISGGDYDGINVGVVDTYKDLADTVEDSDYYYMHDSSDESETKFVNYVLSPTTVTFYAKEETPDPLYYATDTPNVFAYFLVTPPTTEYFIIKNAGFWALFENVDEKSWAVFDTTDIPVFMNIPDDDDAFTVSHVSRFDTAAPVPEPSTLLLLGAGIAGLAVYRRKKN